MASTHIRLEMTRQDKTAHDNITQDTTRRNVISLTIYARSPLHLLLRPHERSYKKGGRVDEKATPVELCKTIRCIREHDKTRETQGKTRQKKQHDRTTEDNTSKDKTKQHTQDIGRVKMAVRVEGCGTNMPQASIVSFFLAASGLK